jgi:GAF domain.
MNQELDTIEPKLKEILYRCLEDIKARKAALYLMDDQEDRYQVVTEYGFRDAAKKGTIAKEEVIDRLIMKRTPFFVNSLTEDSRFSELLFAADTTRMLVAPIYSRGRLVGFIDMRDKSEKAPFGSADLESSQKIVDLFVDFFAQKNLFGQKAPTLTNVKTPVLEQTREMPPEASAAAGPGAISAAVATRQSARSVAA